MAHGAINDEYISPGVRYFERIWDGQVLVSDSIVVRRTHIVNASAATTNNLRRSDGTRPPSNWLRQGGVMHGVRGTCTYTRKVGASTVVDRWSGQLASPGLQPGGIPTPFPEGEIEAIRKALGKSNEAYVKLGVALRESRDTSRLLSKYYKGAGDLTEKLRKRAQGDKRVRQQFRDFARHGWKEAPSAYLEYLFGIKPLADDLTNAVQVLHDSKQHGGAFNMTLRGKFDRSDSSSERAYQSQIGMVSAIVGSIAVRQRSRASLCFQLPDWYWDRLPPVTFFQEGWETTRLSFVLDWVLPINSWLQGFEGNQLRPFFREGSRSTLLQRRLSGNHVTQTDVSWSGSMDGGSDYSYTRSAMANFPTGELLMTLPRFKDTLGLNQLQVGSALLAQRLSQLARTISRN